MQTKLFAKDVLTVLVLLIALIPMFFIPFQDTSEPRYAEMARIMYSTGDWVTPWFAPGEPFWGKPPLSYWVQAIGMHIFGVNEFAARFPAWLAMFLSLLALRISVARVYGSSVAQWSVLIYASMVLSAINTGAVLTDPYLALGTTLIFSSFLVCMQPSEESQSIRLWAYLGFVGLVIGLLAKGPLTLVLVGVPIAVYLAWHKMRWQQFFKAYPWRNGLILTALLVLPWYIMAEIKTPGFLRYFIWGEHVLRFIEPGWKGDLYGTAHLRPHGTIWLYTLAAVLPWWPLVVFLMLKRVIDGRFKEQVAVLKVMPLKSFVLAFSLVCAAFFTFSSNILWTYLLPSLAAMAVLFAYIIDMKLESHAWLQKASYLALLFPLLTLFMVVVGTVEPNIWRSEKGIVLYAQQTTPNMDLYYYEDRPFSARFYSQERVKLLKKEQLNSELSPVAPYLLAVKKSAVTEFEQPQHLVLEKVFDSKRYQLFKVVPGTGTLKNDKQMAD